MDGEMKMVKKKKTYITKLTQDQMVEKLIQWNPHWKVEDLQDMKYITLVAIYAQERAKVLEEINLQYGGS